MKRLILAFCLVFSSFSLLAQGVFAPMTEDYQHLIYRYETLDGRFLGKHHTSWRPIERKVLAEYSDSLLADTSGRFSKQDLFNLTYLNNDNPEWLQERKNQSKFQWLAPLYGTVNDAFAYYSSDFDVHINPLINYSLGQDREDGNRYYDFARGIEARGTIGKKIGFYTSITENQLYAPQFVADRVARDNALPNEGFWKAYRGSLTDFDFFAARGYITAQILPQIQLQFGHDRQFLGNGYRSLALSDFSTPYNFLKLQTKVWRFQYTNLFAELLGNVRAIPRGGVDARFTIPNKFMAMHHLSLNITDNLNIGVWESVVFSRGDSLGRGSSFDFSYLNPIIFYRYAEQYRGSPDNALLGADFKWLLVKRLQLYGQFTLDEFLISNLRSNRGWWGNKYGLQIGGRYFNALGIKNLDLQGEFNMVTPFTYAHDSYQRSYTHYNMPLAHPIGANFREVIGILRYQPVPRLNLIAKGFIVQVGEDSTGISGTDASGRSYGNNPNMSYNLRRGNEGYFLLTGVMANQLMLDLTATFQIRHNCFIDARYIYRTKVSEMESRNQLSGIAMISVRINTPRRLFDF